jgi:hypothetical protein
LRHKKEGDPNWFKAFGFNFYIASLIHDDIIFKELARLTQRKASQKQKGRRSLRFWILFLWMPGCFWAMTKDGIRDRLKSRHPDLEYATGSIKTAISDLKLRRPIHPLYRGFDHNGQLVPRR